MFGLSARWEVFALMSVLCQSACSMSSENTIRHSESEAIGVQIIHGSFDGKVEDLFFLGMVETGRLAEAAGRGDATGMQRAINQGASINGVGELGLTPLLWALNKRSPEGFRWLLENGADPNVVSCCDGKALKLSPMPIAAAIDDSQYLRALLSHSGNPNVVDNAVQRTPLFVAVLFNQTQNIQILLDHHADINAVEADNALVGGFGESVLAYAAGLNHFRTALLLLKAGANPCLKDGTGRTVADFISTHANTGVSDAEQQAFSELRAALKQSKCE